MGGSVSVENEVIGKILFQRKSTTGKMDSRRLLYYRKHVLLPFVERLRELMQDGYIWGLEVPSSLTSVNWSDGDWAYIAAICDNDRMQRDIMNHILACKHTGGASLVQQFADIMATSKILNNDNKITSLMGESTILKERVTRAFQETRERSELILQDRKLKAVY